jgi:hypothetical protein
MVPGLQEIKEGRREFDPLKASLPPGKLFIQLSS